MEENDLTKFLRAMEEMGHTPVSRKMLNEKKDPVLHVQSELPRRKSKTYTLLMGSVGLLFLTGVGVAAASERALPGHMLYPFKIHVNEKVISALALTPRAKEWWEKKENERRAKEQERLGVLGGMILQQKEENVDEAKEVSPEIKTDEKKLEEKKTETQDTQSRTHQELSQTLAKQKQTIKESTQKEEPQEKKKALGEVTKQITKLVEKGKEEVVKSVDSVTKTLPSVTDSLLK